MKNLDLRPPTGTLAMQDGRIMAGKQEPAQLYRVVPGRKKARWTNGL
jgi:hypothetical protein